MGRLTEIWSQDQEYNRHDYIGERTNTAGEICLTPEIKIDGKVQAIIIKVADEWDEALKELGD